MRDVTVQTRAPANVVLDVDSSAVRRSSALVLFLVFAWLVVLLQRNHHHPDWQAGGRLAWSLAILVTVALICRGIFLGRPVTAAHAAAASAALLAGLGAHLLSFDLLGNVMIASAGWVLTWPTSARLRHDELPRVWALVDATHGDPLAPFAMQSRKSAFFNADGTAMLAYRTRAGFAVVSGDPIGDATRFRELVEDFTATCHARGWRIVVLGCSEKRLGLWDGRIRPALRAVPFGRDVVIDVARFDMVGRKYRNLRQAVQRTRNTGVSTEVVAEGDLDDATRAELIDVLYASHAGVRTERGFSMILDGALEGRYPGVLLAIARDRSGRVQAFHRYAMAGGGNDVSLDVPWRRPGAPNGIDERLSVDMVAWARAHGARRLSLAFAAFPEIFDDRDRGPVQRIFYVLIHLGDSLIRLESLYRYLAKYHALGERRYVLLSLRHVVPALFVLLTLEFTPHRRRLPLRADSERRDPRAA
ncbi:bifunctional lysylphosphatidylglycerol flippase/synthetase MprF [Mycolicibacterium sp. 050158]|uniref:bifunctional lysylphosphatidylglycerol flippase/synthetase MprF n=1 Tax=Mycolicibacterium sp. 050158 TaxID=3090602 RepID=UPI00299F2CC6|nr:phosphatidylglycerol lysyltransferase domain-containing protein [Mycolicibacterium sp. 050158]MDX1890771.1 phosphatidylglycerol lysyltransferase domain-containing protein [Mycolicibacterium sp. 050158]